jgi:hypothetical protein
LGDDVVRAVRGELVSAWHSEEQDRIEAAWAAAGNRPLVRLGFAYARAHMFRQHGEGLALKAMCGTHRDPLMTVPFAGQSACANCRLCVAKDLRGDVPLKPRATPARDDVLEALKENGPMLVHELVSHIGRPERSTRHTLAAVLDAGLVVHVGEVRSGAKGRPMVLWGLKGQTMDDKGEA